MPVARNVTVLGAAIALIASFTMTQEGERFKPYRDVNGITTVCYGHTGTDVNMNHTYTQAECAAFLRSDMTVAGNGVLKYSPNLDQHENQLAAAIDFSYNVGVGTYSKSSVRKDFNAENFKAGCSALLKYVYGSDGKYYQDLANRRQAEYRVCMKGL